MRAMCSILVLYNSRLSACPWLGSSAGHPGSRAVGAVLCPLLAAPFYNCRQSCRGSARTTNNWQLLRGCLLLACAVCALNHGICLPLNLGQRILEPALRLVGTLRSPVLKKLLGHVHCSADCRASAEMACCSTPKQSWGVSAKS